MAQIMLQINLKFSLKAKEYHYEYRETCDLNGFYGGMLSCMMCRYESKYKVYELRRTTYVKIARYVYVGH